MPSRLMPSRLMVDAQLEALARLERQHLACGDLDAVPRLWIAPPPRGLAADAEVAEAHDLDILALLEAAEDDVEQRFHHRGGLPFRQPVGRHRVDEIVLRQCGHLPSIGMGSRPPWTQAGAPSATGNPSATLTEAARRSFTSARPSLSAEGSEAAVTGSTSGCWSRTSAPLPVSGSPGAPLPRARREPAEPSSGPDSRRPARRGRSGRIRRRP